MSDCIFKFALTLGQCIFLDCTNKLNISLAKCFSHSDQGKHMSLQSNLWLLVILKIAAVPLHCRSPLLPSLGSHAFLLSACVCRLLPARLLLPPTRLPAPFGPYACFSARPLENPSTCFVACQWSSAFPLPLGYAIRPRPNLFFLIYKLEAPPSANTPAPLHLLHMSEAF